MPLAGTGQQEPMFSQYLFDGLIVNPAFSGNGEQAIVTTAARKQWLDIERSPSTLYLGGHMPSPDRRNGFGFTLMRDAIGFNDVTNLNLTYAYRIPAGNGNLSLGLLGGLHHFHSNLLIIKTKELGDPAFFFNQVNRILPNCGAGIYFDNSKIFAGASVPNVIASRLNPADRPDLQARRYVSFNFYGGANIHLEDGTKFRPSLLLRYAPGLPVSLDLSGSIFLKNLIWAGISWRHREALVLFTSIRIQQYRIGYSYDFVQSPLTANSAGSQEIMLSFDIGFTKNNQQSPRIF